jgi:hypothetical protein
MEMIAKAEKIIKDGLYESPSSKRKVDEDRIRRILERNAPSRPQNDESKQGDKSANPDEQNR